MRARTLDSEQPLQQEGHTHISAKGAKIPFCFRSYHFNFSLQAWQSPTA